MTRVPLNNPALVRRYVDAFERRFTRIESGVVYRRHDFDSGVILPPALAADIMAGMRAGIEEADAHAPLTMARVLPVVLAAPLLLIMLGAIADYMAAAGALITPVVCALLLLGPGLGALRVHLAWRRGVDKAEAAMAGFDPAVRGTVPGNRARSVYLVVVLFAGAIITGLFAASWSAPVWQQLAIDRLLGAILGPIAVLVIALALVSRALDVRRRRVSEADIDAARVTRGNRPLD